MNLSARCHGCECRIAAAAAKLGAGSEAYAPLARAILGGLGVSVVLTVFLVPAAYLLVHGRRPALQVERSH